MSKNNMVYSKFKHLNGHQNGFYNNIKYICSSPFWHQSEGPHVCSIVCSIAAPGICSGTPGSRPFTSWLRNFVRFFFRCDQTICLSCDQIRCLTPKWTWIWGVYLQRGTRNHPKLLLKAMDFVGGYPNFRKPPYKYITTLERSHLGVPSYHQT